MKGSRIQSPDGRENAQASMQQQPGDDEAASEFGYSPVAAWTSVAILLIFSLISILDRQIIALMVEPIKRDLVLTDTQLGLLQGFAFALFYSLASVPIGWAVDRMPRRIILYAGITIWSLSAASCGLAKNFWQLFLGRTMVGVGEASLTPTAVSLIGDLFPKNKMGTAMGIYAAGFYLGSGISLILGGLIVGAFAGRSTVDFPLIGQVAPWQAVFLVTGLPGVVFALMAFLITDPRSRRAVAERTDRRRVQPFSTFLALRWRVVVHTFGAYGLATLVAYAMGAWTPAYLSRVFGWRPEQIGWTWGLAVAVAGTVGALVGGSLIDRLYRAGLRDAVLVVPAIAVMIAWPFIVGGYSMPTPLSAIAMLCVGMTALGIGSAGSFATWQHIAPSDIRGRVSASFVLVASFMGAGAGPVAVAVVTDHVLVDEALVGQSVAIVVSIALPAMSLLLLTARGALRRLPS